LSFSGLYHLLQKLYQKNALLNPEFAEIFEEKPKETLLQQWKDWVVTPALQAPDLSQLPFFRTLDPSLCKLFQDKAQVFKLGARTRLCRIGEVKRDLFVSLEGQIDVYKQQSDAHLSWVTSIPPKSLFGEVSFFLGKPRTAEVVTRTDVKILRIRFDESFAPLIDQQGAQSVIQRFWLIHALNASPLFSRLPESSYDQILNIGKIREFKPGEILFRQGDKGNQCWIIIQGQIEIDQHGQVINQAQKGDLVGEMALMANQGQRSAGAKCVRPTVALEVDQQLFYKLLSLNFVLGHEIEGLVLERMQRDDLRDKQRVGGKK
jgi:CRP-like cAMP-binding protein